MNKTTNSATAKLVGEKRPDVDAALAELESSVTTLEELTGNLAVRLSPVCSDQEQTIGATAESPKSACQVSGCVRDLDRRAYALTCRIRYLLSVLEV